MFFRLHTENDHRQPRVGALDIPQDIKPASPRHVDVEDHQTSFGEDITRLILTQIIVEDAKTPDSTFPLDLLRQMVVASGRATQENSLKYMRAMLDLYQNAYRAMTQPSNPFEFMQNLRPNREAPVNERRTPVREAVSSTERQEPNPPKTAEVMQLKDRLAVLEKMVASMTSVPAKKKTK